MEAVLHAGKSDEGQLDREPCGTLGEAVEQCGRHGRRCGLSEAPVQDGHKSFAASLPGGGGIGSGGVGERADQIARTQDFGRPAAGYLTMLDEDSFEYEQAEVARVRGNERDSNRARLEAE